MESIEFQIQYYPCNEIAKQVDLDGKLVLHLILVKSVADVHLLFTVSK